MLTAFKVNYYCQVHAEEHSTTFGKYITSFCSNNFSGNGAQPAEKLHSISATRAYEEKKHKELRWEDYESGDKDKKKHLIIDWGHTHLFGSLWIETSCWNSKTSY